MPATSAGMTTAKWIERRADGVRGSRLLRLSTRHPGIRAANIRDPGARRGRQQARHGRACLPSAKAEAHGHPIPRTARTARTEGWMPALRGGMTTAEWTERTDHA